MTFDFLLYGPRAVTALSFTVEAASEAVALTELAARMVGIGIAPSDLKDWRIAVTVVRTGRA